MAVMLAGIRKLACRIHNRRATRSILLAVLASNRTRSVQIEASRESVSASRECLAIDVAESVRSNRVIEPAGQACRAAWRAEVSPLRQRRELVTVTRRWLNTANIETIAIDAGSLGRMTRASCSMASSGTNAYPCSGSITAPMQRH